MPKKMREALGIIIFFTACLLVPGYFAWRLAIVCMDFAGHRRATGWTPQAFILYRWEEWFARTRFAGLKIIFVIFMFLLLSGTALYWSLLRTGIWHAAWSTMKWLVGNDGGEGEETYIGAALGGFTSLIGLVFFGIMLTLLHQSFVSWVEAIKEGYSPVLEREHIIIIGQSEQVILLLQELCDEYKSQGGTKVVVLTQGQPKPMMEERILEARIQPHGSRIFVRSGFGQSVEHLEFVSASLASRIIIMGDESHITEVRDAITMQILVALGSQGWPLNGRVLAEASLWKNHDLLQRFGAKDNVDVVMIDRWMARLLIESSWQDNIGSLCDQVLDHRASSFFVQPLPSHLVGKTFVEAAAYYPDAIPVGVVTSEGDCRFGAGVGADRKLIKGADIVLLADSEQLAVAKDSPQFELMPPLAAHMPSAIRQARDSGPEVIFIFGWGHLVQVLLVELDKIVAPGTRLVLVSLKPIEEREQKIKKAQLRWEHPFKNIEQPCQHVIGQLGSQFMLDELPEPLEQARRIFILADDSLDADPMVVDACTLTTLLQVRNNLAAKGLATAIPIIPQIRNPRSKDLCEFALSQDYLDTAGMRVEVLATLCRHPALLPILRELLFFEGEFSFQSRSLQDYLPRDELPPRELSFLDAQAIVCATGDVVIGWTLGDEPMISTPTSEFGPRRNISRVLSPHYVATITDLYQRAHGSMPPAEVVLNPPDKHQARPWSSRDRLFVIGRYS